MKRKMMLLAALCLSVGLLGCGPEYDFKALGFADKAEMDAAFAKGYHTKKKFVEMNPPPKAEPQQVQAQPKPPIEEAKAPQPETPPASPVPVEPTKTVEVQPQATPTTNSSAELQAASNCEDVKACTKAMLVAAKGDNLTAAMDAARRIDGFAKPERGDRKSARKLNNDGLEAFKQGNMPDAIALLSKARDADKLDEEIVSNLVFVYSEDGNYTKAITIATEGFILNPRRASLWMPYAIAHAKTGDKATALQALWLAWQFSANKEKMLETLEKKIAAEQDANMKAFYTEGKAWFVESKKPSL